MVALTGCSLKSSLKMRTDTSGASYAIYWAKVNNKLVVAGDYVTEASRETIKEAGLTGSYAEESEAFTLDANGDGPIAACFKSGMPVFIDDVAGSAMKRKEIAAKYGIKQVIFTPMEGGVMEYGTAEGTEWMQPPDCPTMPKAAMRKGFEFLGASYCLFWQNKDGSNFEVVADYTTEARRFALKKVRGDDKTFGTESKAFKLPADGNGPVATAFKTGQESVISDMTQMKRADLAKEFGIKKVHFVPTEEGVLEYGTPSTAFLSGAMLDASLKMQCDVSGAGYAMYWKESDGQLTIVGDYITPARRAALDEQEIEGSFAKASREVTIDIDGIGPIGKVMREREPMFVKEVPYETTMKRRSIAQNYGIKSIMFMPVEGGVMEYGTAKGPSTADWYSIEDAKGAALPVAEMRAGFEQGATHMIFWKDNGEGQYEAAASFVLPERVRALALARGDDKTYTSESIKMKFDVDGDGPIATAAKSGAEFIVAGAAASAPVASFGLSFRSGGGDDNKQDKFKRAALAKEFNINNIHFVPCLDGVLEYGVGAFGDAESPLQASDMTGSVKPTGAKVTEDAPVA